MNDTIGEVNENEESNENIESVPKTFDKSNLFVRSG